jgi:hypothetical protein
LWETVPMCDYMIAESVAFITSHASTL